MIYRRIVGCLRLSIVRFQRAASTVQARDSSKRGQPQTRSPHVRVFVVPPGCGRLAEEAEALCEGSFGGQGALARSVQEAGTEKAWAANLAQQSRILSGTCQHVPLLPHLSTKLIWGRQDFGIELPDDHIYAWPQMEQRLLQKGIYILRSTGRVRFPAN